ncbi:MAG: hypothetical protein L0Y38_10420 [Methylococcaceae bacterium]|nr:hypothetical protein [Methylococcaceae bacterium]
MSLPFIFLILLTLWVPTASVAVEIYSDKQLADDKERYVQKFKFLLEKGLRDFMTPDERRATEGVVLWHTTRAAGPLAFTSMVFEGRPTVRAPLSSIKFVEDLSIAYAWRYQNGYSLEPFDEYLVMLKHRPAEHFPGGRLPDPITALGVPPRIWERDPKVDDLSLRFRNTAWAFILAHELAHLRFGHTLTDASPAEIQRQEEAADEFAVDLLGRSHTIPMGMILWFQATAGYMKNRSDFTSDAAYFEWARTGAEHPVNGSRMRNLAATMTRQAAAERDPNQADVLKFIAVKLATIGETIEDPDMQQFLKRCATSRDPEDLKRLKDRPCF